MACTAEAAESNDAISTLQGQRRPFPRSAALRRGRPRSIRRTKPVFVSVNCFVAPSDPRDPGGAVGASAIVKGA